MFYLSKALMVLSVSVLIFLSGCASVPMASEKEDALKKEFLAPPEGKSGLYIYRNSSFGGALKKSIYVDGVLIGESAPNTYFYKEVNAGDHTLSTESEFSNNDLMVKTKQGLNYFVEQFIKFGLFVGGAGLKLASEEEGKKGVLETKLAQ